MSRQDRRRRIAALRSDPAAAASFPADMKAATALHKQGRVKEAADAYRKIVKAYAGHPDLRVAWTNLGAAWQGLGRLDDAVAAHKKARALNPLAPTPHHNLGMALLAQKKREEALASLRKAVELQPDFRDAWVGLGLAAEAVEDWAAAEDAYRKAIAADPDSGEARFNLAATLHRAGRRDEALAVLEDLATRMPRNAEAPFAIGRILQEGGDPAAAIARYLQALALAPAAEPIHAQTSQALRRLLELDPASAATLADAWTRTAPESLTARHLAAAIRHAATGEPPPPRPDPAFVLQLFERFAPVHDDALERLGNAAPGLLRDAVAGLLPAPAADLAVLDAGCGTGLCGPWLKPYAHHLTGADLSPAMLQRAKAGGRYNDLRQGDVLDLMRGRPSNFGLIAACDLLPYLGEPSDFFTLAARALTAGGTLALTAEAAEDAAGDGLVLKPSGRYLHGAALLRTRAEAAGLAVVSLEPAELRTEAGQPVPGLVMLARKP